MTLTAEGRIFSWGRGSFGRLGLGDERDRYSPAEVNLPGASGDRVPDCRLSNARMCLHSGYDAAAILQ